MGPARRWIRARRTIAATATTPVRPHERLRRRGRCQTSTAQCRAASCGASGYTPAAFCSGTTTTCPRHDADAVRELRLHDLRLQDLVHARDARRGLRQRAPSAWEACARAAVGSVTTAPPTRRARAERASTASAATPPRAGSARPATVPIPGPARAWPPAIPSRTTCACRTASAATPGTAPTNQKCEQIAAGTKCGKDPSCSGGTQTSGRTCDGSGTCQDADGDGLRPVRLWRHHLQDSCA